MKKTFVLYILFCFFYGCSSSIIPKHNHVVEYLHQPESTPSEYGDTFDWQNKSPVDFLNMLKKLNKRENYIVHGIHKNWIKKSDIPHLMDLLNSSELCASVAMSQSSYIELGGSTVGAEAAFLIIGFQKGEYPPGLNSTRPKLTQKEKNNLKQWWSRFN